MSIDLVKTKSSTYDAPVLQDPARIMNLYAGYGKALNQQNRTCSIIFTDMPNINVTGTSSRWVIPWEYFKISAAIKSIKKETVLTLAEARNIAIANLENAEKRRLQESENEARFWVDLDGE